MADSQGMISLVVKEQIAWITLENPSKHNSLAAADIGLFISHLELVGDSADIRVLVVTGTGDKTFCAGASLDQMSSGDMSGEQFQRLTDRLADMSIPTICALNGSVYGGGAEIGLCCDIRVGVTGMKLLVPAARFGLCYPLNGIGRYVHRLGVSTAKRLLISAETLDEKSLMSLGYLTHLVEGPELMKTVEKMAESISKLAPLAVSSMKKICDQIADGSLCEQEALALIQMCQKSNDLQEGLRAVGEKRPPIFTGN
ncbi:MAG: enoyl-CoA hydratase/isomerase family protein [Porticoccus sp.]|nr:enoyl-CoA hydratase/isomerase family protein [Porticoccus sp.]